MTLLIDTNIAVLLRDRDVVLRQRFLTRREPLAISLVSLVELEGGVVAHAHLASSRRRALDRLLPRLNVIKLDRTVADAYRSIVERTGFSRRKILDRLIAATALVHDLPLVTTNAEDFRDIPGLRLEVWPAAQ